MKFPSTLLTVVILGVGALQAQSGTKVLFAGPQTGVILLPIMLFHQMQLMACAFIARRYGNQTETD